jgi:hypothetical protein
VARLRANGGRPPRFCAFLSGVRITNSNHGACSSMNADGESLFNGRENPDVKKDRESA